MPNTFGSLSILGWITRLTAFALGVAFVADEARSITASGTPDWYFSADYWISLMAPFWYLGALWAVSSVFMRMDRGEAFGPAMVKCVKDVGACMMYGAFAAVVLTPSLNWLAANGFRYLKGVKYEFSIESLTIGIIGLALYLMVKRGQALKQELDQIV